MAITMQEGRNTVLALQYALINKRTLLKIIEKKKITNEYILLKTKLKQNKYSQWVDINNPLLPTIKQAKSIAACIHVPFAGLYMEPNLVPYKSIPSIKNKRTLFGTQAMDESAVNIAIMDLLQELDYLLALSDELEETIPQYNMSAPASDNSKEWANYIRDALSLDLQEQFRCTSTRKLYHLLRTRIEAQGIFVQCFRDVPVEVLRGIAICDEKIPIIGLNEGDRPPAKSFSMIHELVHILKRESSMCNDMYGSSAFQEEVFCNAVAAEVLVPEDSLRLLLSDKYGSQRPLSKDDIKQIADKFSVSRDVIARRLYDLKIITTTAYKTYLELFRLEIEHDKEEQRIARKEGRAPSIPRDISRETVDRTSPLISNCLLNGYANDFLSKQEISRHLGIDQKHIDRYLWEVSTWNK